MNNYGQSIMLMLSAITPVVIFSRLVLLRSQIPEPFTRVVLEQKITKHFSDSLNHQVKISCGKEKLEGYFVAFSTGEYIFYQTDHTEVIQLKKGATGWALIKISDGDQRKRIFIMPMILHLERKLFN